MWTSYIRVQSSLSYVIRTYFILTVDWSIVLACCVWHECGPSHTHLFCEWKPVIALKMHGQKQEFSPIGKAFLLTLNVAGWLWSAISFVPWYYLSGQYMRKKPGNQQAVLTSNGAYRCIANVKELVGGYDGISTACGLFG